MLEGKNGLKFKEKEICNMGYVVAYKKSNRKNAKEYYFLKQEGKIVVSEYIVDADIFNTKKEAQQFIDEVGDNRMYIIEYKIEVYELV